MSLLKGTAFLALLLGVALVTYVCFAVVLTITTRNNDVKAYAVLAVFLLGTVALPTVVARRALGAGRSRLDAFTRALVTLFVVQLPIAALIVFIAVLISE
ncbi:MAG TPA: hypothetical protein VNB24_02535 [Acidimicrobiales bacterium]|nr:hypothetical protein [Acidimicrobiales bacterium]